MKKAILIVLALAGFAVQNGAAESGGGFADFRKQQQARLLAHIDGALAAKAQDVITDNFAAVKKANVQLQTELGGRKGNFGINLIGAIDESADSAFGWQLRGYAGPDSVKGANAGVFYRKMNKGALFGANAFLDYEDGDYGGFSRFGIGGEVRHAIVALAANYYLPLTDEKKVNSTLAAFSRQGFDAKLRVSVPQFDAVKLAVDYYNFDGERGAESDDGLRYGVELHPFAGFRLDVLYDDGAEKFGGNIAYSHTIGEVQKRESNAAFSPDMFAAVSREYSQRIATVAAGPAVSLLLTPTLTVTTTMTAAAMTTTITLEAEMVAASRVVNAHFITRGDGLNANLPASGGRFRLISTRFRYLVTLPPLPAARPFVLTLSRNLFDGNRHAIIDSSQANEIGFHAGFRSAVIPWTITIVQGSEQIVGEPTTTTLTTRTTTTMAAITTTTRITTFSTMFITLTANAAMDDIPPLDSRFRPKGGSYEMAALERRGNDKQPSFPRKRESKPLSFVHLRDSANGDLSPQMANRRVRKAHS